MNTFHEPRAAWALLPLTAFAVLVLSCNFAVDPNGDARFSCDSASDCGEGFECIDQVGTDRGLCFAVGTCEDDETRCDGQDENCNGAVDDVSWAGTACATDQPGICADGLRACVEGEERCNAVQAARAETCNMLDDDCDGAVDEDFDLATDENHCGACGVVCGAGTECSFALCAERACADGEDNDGDNLPDCDDADCLDRSCDDADAFRACGLGVAGADGGDDAGVPDAGTADAGTPDAGSPDAGDVDGGDPDAGDVDGGMVTDAGGDDAGVTDAGSNDGGVTLVPACVLRETPQARGADACMNGLDDDGDDAIDCADTDCAMQVCASDGGVCQAGTCQGM